MRLACTYSKRKMRRRKTPGNAPGQNCKHLGPGCSLVAHASASSDLGRCPEAQKRPCGSVFLAGPPRELGAGTTRSLGAPFNPTTATFPSWHLVQFLPPLRIRKFSTSGVIVSSVNRGSRTRGLESKKNAAKEKRDTPPAHGYYPDKARKSTMGFQESSSRINSTNAQYMPCDDGSVQKALALGTLRLNRAIGWPIWWQFRTYCERAQPPLIRCHAGLFPSQHSGGIPRISRQIRVLRASSTRRNTGFGDHDFQPGFILLFLSSFPWIGLIFIVDPRRNSWHGGLPPPVAFSIGTNRTGAG